MRRPQLTAQPRAGGHARRLAHAEAADKGGRAADGVNTDTFDIRVSGSAAALGHGRPGEHTRDFLSIRD